MISPKHLLDPEIVLQVLCAACAETGEAASDVLAGAKGSRARVYAFLVLSRQFPRVYGADVMRALGVSHGPAKDAVNKARKAWYGEDSKSWFKVSTLQRVLEAVGWGMLTTEECERRLSRAAPVRSATLCKPLPARRAQNAISRSILRAVMAEARKQVPAGTDQKSKEVATRHARELAWACLSRQYPELAGYRIAKLLGVREEQTHNFASYTRNLLQGSRENDWFTLDKIAAILAALGWPALTDQEIAERAARVRPALEQAGFNLFIPERCETQTLQPYTVGKAELAPIKRIPGRPNYYRLRRGELRSDQIVRFVGDRK